MIKVEHGFCAMVVQEEQFDANTLGNRLCSLARS